MDYTTYRSPPMPKKSSGTKRKRATEGKMADSVNTTPQKRGRKAATSKSQSGYAVVDLTGDDDDDAHVTPSAKKKRSKSTKEAGPSEEKRLSKFRTKAPVSYDTLYHRAITQRMFVLDRRRGPTDECLHGTGECPSETIELAGSTGNVYTVTITHKPTCSCPYFAKGHAECKHIIYALVKVLKAPTELQYQLAFLTSELEEILENAGPLPTEQAVHQHESGGARRHPVEGDCAICCEDLNAEAEEVVWCRGTCGNNLHKSCFQQWAATKRGSTVTCPYCRQVWKQLDEALDIRTLLDRGKGTPRGPEGYINVAAQLGISGRRDYSSYHPHWVQRQLRRGLILEDTDDVYWG